MSKPLIFTISAVWDEEASVWSGHCDDIPAAADAPSLDELLNKISAMALDVLPDNHLFRPLGYQQNLPCQSYTGNLTLHLPYNSAQSDVIDSNR